MAQYSMDGASICQVWEVCPNDIIFGRVVLAASPFNRLVCGEIVPHVIFEFGTFAGKLDTKIMPANAQVAVLKS